MEEKEFFAQYCEFVDSITSEDSKNDTQFLERAKMLSKTLNGQYARLDTAVAGIAGEAGEIADVWKKIKFHSKDLTEERKQDLLYELGDMYWYLAQASMALGVTPEEIVKMNMGKLKKRHPHGFSNEYMTKF